MSESSKHTSPSGVSATPTPSTASVVETTPAVTATPVSTPVTVKRAELVKLPTEVAVDAAADDDLNRAWNALTPGQRRRYRQEERDWIRLDQTRGLAHRRVPICGAQYSERRANSERCHTTLFIPFFESRRISKPAGAEAWAKVRFANGAERWIAFGVGLAVLVQPDGLVRPIHAVAARFGISLGSNIGGQSGQ
jgi:hypothetical protein